ncbi:MAG: Ku protein, partial [Myxococcales bacterium]|nr:Ku protein [Myxococcales bacterium]
MPARAIGTATISFGLVSIPIKLFTSTESGGEIHFNMLHDACGSRLKQQYICTKDGEVVDREHMVKGYEFAKGSYVVMTPDELKALDAVATNSVDLTEFVPASAVDPLYIEKSYYLGPDKGGERAYRLLREAMLETGLVGIASYSARGKQYVVMVRPYQDGLALHQLRYAAEIKDWKEVPLPDLPEVKEAELQLAKQIIQQIASDGFEPIKYKDEVRSRMLELIQQKIDGEEITAAPEAPQGKIIDLMEALKASLGAKAAATGGDERKPALAATPAADAAADDAP